MNIKCGRVTNHIIKKFSIGDVVINGDQTALMYLPNSAAPPASRPSTQPRPSGGPGVTSQPRPSYTQRDRGSAIEQEPGCK